MSSGVEFDEDKFSYGARPTVPGARPNPGIGSGPVYQAYGGVGGNQPKMVRWLMKKGIVKSPAGAQGVLIGLVIINIIITFVVITYFL